jgi:arylsulfatase
MSGGDNDRPDMTRDGRPIIYPKNKEVLSGPETTFSSLGPKWANVANTPFRFWKAKMYEGGICTPMIAYWPKGIKKNVGGITSQMGHVMDIMATCVDLAKAKYPKEYNGKQIIPMEGMSLSPIFQKGKREGHQYIGFEHFNEKALIGADRWKILKKPGKDTKWELYDLNNDRTEMYDVSAQHPEKVKAMVQEYDDWAKRCMVVPAP